MNDLPAKRPLPFSRATRMSSQLPHDFGKSKKRAVKLSKKARRRLALARRKAMPTLLDWLEREQQAEATKDNIQEAR